MIYSVVVPRNFAQNSLIAWTFWNQLLNLPQNPKQKSVFLPFFLSIIFSIIEILNFL